MCYAFKRHAFIKANGSEKSRKFGKFLQTELFLVSIKSVRYVSSNFGVVVHPFMTL